MHSVAALISLQQALEATDCQTQLRGSSFALTDQIKLRFGLSCVNDKSSAVVMVNMR
jgi:hypothetical protein